MTHRSKRSRFPWLPYFISLPAALWVMLWFSINTGPWVLDNPPTSLLGTLHYIRTFFPFIALFLALVLLSQEKSAPYPWPLRLWLIYGAIGVVAALVASPNPLHAMYWSAAYLAALTALKAYLQEADVLQRTMYLNYLSWAVAALFLLLQVFLIRDALLATGPAGMLSGYGVVHRVESIAGGMPVSRSSGLARFAAVPGVVAFVLLFSAKKWKWLLCLAVFLGAGFLIYVLKSRGAIYGFAFALAFVVFFWGGRVRWPALIAGLLLIPMMNILPAGLQQSIEENVRFTLTRGASYEEIQQLTGRVHDWEMGLRKLKKSPLIGFGMQSDRYLVGVHIHNTYLYAIMQAGYVGGALFIAGLIWAWVLFLRAVYLRLPDRLGQKAFFLQASGLLAFFTVRSIPEVCGPYFAVDLLVMLPAIAYLGLLNHPRYFREQARHLHTTRQTQNV